MKRLPIVSMALAAAVALAACQAKTLEERQADALALKPQSLGDRQMQSRRFETKDETMILSASAGVLQDLGFTIDESSVETGLVVASKKRDAVESGQVAGAFMVALLAAAAGQQADPTFDTVQRIRVSLVSRPVPGGAVVVRVTFQRILWDNRGRVSGAETINQADIYQQFFDKLAQSVFLEAHQI